MSNDPLIKHPRRSPSKKKLELFGWVIFVFSALCFIVASIGNPWAMAGSVLFLLACFVFLILHMRPDT